MNKTTQEINKYKILQEQSDFMLDKQRKDIEILKSKLETKSEQFIPNQPSQDSKMINMVDAQIKEYNVRISSFIFTKLKIYLMFCIEIFAIER